MSDEQSQTQNSHPTKFVFPVNSTKTVTQDKNKHKPKHLNAINYLLSLSYRSRVLFKKPSYKSELKSITLQSPIPISKLKSTLILIILYILTLLYYLP